MADIKVSLRSVKEMVNDSFPRLFYFTSSMILVVFHSFTWICHFDLSILYFIANQV